MQRLEVSGAVRPIRGSLGVKRLKVLTLYRRTEFTKTIGQVYTEVYLSARYVSRQVGNALRVAKVMH